VDVMRSTGSQCVASGVVATWPGHPPHHTPSVAVETSQASKCFGQQGRLSANEVQSEDESRGDAMSTSCLIPAGAEVRRSWFHMFVGEQARERAATPGNDGWRTYKAYIMLHACIYHSD
jgi:hypothetical protein